MIETASYPPLCIGVSEVGKVARSDVLTEPRHRFGDRLVELGVLLDELWNPIKSPGSKAQQVGDHQDLPIAEWAGSNTDGWNRQRIGHRLRDLPRHRLQNETRRS